MRISSTTRGRVPRPSGSRPSWRRPCSSEPLIAGAGLAGTRLLAADGSIVVDQSGGGDFATIAEAVAAATDGDTILIRPGRYVETVEIDDTSLSPSAAMASGIESSSRPAAPNRPRADQQRRHDLGPDPDRPWLGRGHPGRRPDAA